MTTGDRVIQSTSNQIFLMIFIIIYENFYCYVQQKTHLANSYFIQATQAPINLVLSSEQKRSPFQGQGDMRSPINSTAWLFRMISPKKEQFAKIQRRMLVEQGGAHFFQVFSPPGRALAPTKDTDNYPLLYTGNGRWAICTPCRKTKFGRVPERFVMCYLFIKEGIYVCM